MPKRFKKNIYIIKPLDLHGEKHADVFRLVEDYVLNNQSELPLQIITGNSDVMKKIVVEALKTHGFNYMEGDYFNRGYIDVLT